MNSVAAHSRPEPTAKITIQTRREAATPTSGRTPRSNSQVMYIKTAERTITPRLMAINASCCFTFESSLFTLGVRVWNRQDLVVNSLKVSHRSDIRPGSVLEVGVEPLPPRDDLREDVRLQAAPDTPRARVVEDLGLEHIDSGVRVELECRLLPEGCDGRVRRSRDVAVGYLHLELLQGDRPDATGHFVRGEHLLNVEVGDYVAVHREKSAIDEWLGCLELPPRPQGEVSLRVFYRHSELGAVPVGVDDLLLQVSDADDKLREVVTLEVLDGPFEERLAAHWKEALREDVCQGPHPRSSSARKDDRFHLCVRAASMGFTGSAAIARLSARAFGCMLSLASSVPGGASTASTPSRSGGSVLALRSCSEAPHRRGPPSRTEGERGSGLPGT